MNRRKQFPGLIVVTMFLMHLPFSFSQTRPAKLNPGSPRTLQFDGGIAPFKPWLEQDVVWIITDEERAAFRLLKNDQQRDEFIDAFWARRNPTPDAYENEFKTEHYKRIVYANEHFGGRVPGWKTDRGRIYIVYGPPDRIDSNAHTRCGDNESDDDRPQSVAESWCYRYLEGVGTNVRLDFVDICQCGDYRMAMPSELRNVLLMPRGALPGAAEPASPVDPQLYLSAVTTPRVKFLDLERKLDSKLQWHMLPFQVTTDVARATDVTSVVPVTISLKKRDVAPVGTNPSQRVLLNILGRVRTLTGRVSERFEDTMELDASSPSELTLRKSLALMIGRYRLEIAVQKEASDEWGTWIGAIEVGGQ